MTSGVPWHIKGVRREVLDSAREAARRAGISVEEWLDRTIAESARHAGIDPLDQRPPLTAEHPSRAPSPDLWRRSDFEPAERRPATNAFADVSARLDVLSRQLDELSQAGRGRTPSYGGGDYGSPADDTPRLIADVFERLDRKIDRLVEDNRLDRSIARLDRSPPLAVGGPDGGADSVDQALAEIEARQRALDGGSGASPVATAATPADAPSAIDLPRAPTQRLPDLEQQLRQINARIETMRPCGIDGAVETLRDDLAEIGVMLKEALPRQAIEAIEAEIRSLASRLDTERHTGADGSAIANLERGIAEIRDALHALTPAESLVGFEPTLQGLAQKIDRIAATGQDPEALKQLEGAIVALRGVVSHVASNDALTQLSDEVRALSAKVDQVTAADAFSAMERRIAAIADALQQSRGVTAADSAGLETAMRGLADKVDQLHATQSDQTATRYLEDRIVRLVEKLDASDSRLDHLGSIERALADLLIQIESQRLGAGRANPDPSGTDALKRDMQRTQDTLETVHGTLGHLVDRLATIETSIRINPSPRAASATEVPVSLPASARVPLADTDRSPPNPVLDMVPAMLPEAPEPTADPAPAARANPAPAPERRPIDPSLPPDHPLEPGAGRARAASGTPAERIAASEAALENVRPPVIPDPAGKSNFIAAARRAAQAAGSEPPAKDSRRASALPEANRTSPGAAPGAGGGPIRKVLVGASVVAIVLGTLHFVTTRLWPSGGPTGDLATQTAPSPPVAEPPQIIAPPDRHSAAPPPALLAPPGLSPSEALSTPPSIADLETTGTVRQPSPRTAVVPATAPAAATGAAAGRGNAIDRLPAVLRGAAANGDAAAEFEVASRLADGRGVPQNLAEAATWFERAAAKGLAPAQFRLGGLYEKGVGVRKNLDTARRLYVSAAEAGHAKAMHNLAVLYAEGIDGKPNYQTAAQWFRRAADHGVVDSQYNLAVLYARGIGVQTNMAEAFKWFALASREGDGDAAKKRDDIAARLDKPTLTAALAAAKSWQPQPQPDAAVQVKAPAGGWDAAQAPATPKRSVGPKIETPSRRPAQ